MKNLNKDSAVYKMLLLGIVCGICGLLLSGANSLTAPMIEQNKLATIKEKLELIFPGGEFTDVTDQYIGLDETGLVDGVYEAKGQGYIFTMHGIGYNSDGFTFITGFDNDGKIAGFKAIEQKETDGIGARCFTDGGEYEQLMTSLSTADPIPLMSGATLTSTAIQKGMDAAKVVFGGITGGAVVPSGSQTNNTSAPEGSLGAEDFSANEPYCTVWTNTNKPEYVYKCTAKGFEGVNKAFVTVNKDEGKVIGIEVTEFNDTQGVGDAAVAEAELARYAGLTLDAKIDATSGATFTSSSLRAMAAAALKTAAGMSLEPAAAAPAGNTLGSEDFSANEPYCTVWTNTNKPEYVYKCTAKGFEGVNKAFVTVNKDEGKVIAIEVTEFNDTEGVGDAAVAEGELARYAGLTLDQTIDATSGASLTSASLRAMAAAALQAAAGK